MPMRQAYLGGIGVSVRVRIVAESAWLNIKELRLGARRQEFEYPIPHGEAQALMTLAQGGRIEKIRHLVRHGDHLWEIDEFDGDNEGLIVAEIELAHEAEAFARPAWLGREVTGDERYYNVRLSERPFRQWSES